jgi:hypothetical protein
MEPGEDSAESRGFKQLRADGRTNKLTMPPLKGDLLPKTTSCVAGSIGGTPIDGFPDLAMRVSRQDEQHFQCTLPSSSETIEGRMVANQDPVSPGRDASEFGVSLKNPQIGLDLRHKAYRRPKPLLTSSWLRPPLHLLDCPFRAFPDRLHCQPCVDLRRGPAAVAQGLLDHLQRRPGVDLEGSQAAPQVVHTQVLQPGPFNDPLPAIFGSIMCAVPRPCAIPAYQRRRRRDPEVAAASQSHGGPQAAHAQSG